MSLSREITALVQKEFRLEFRNRAAISSMLLYVVSTIFVCYQSFIVIEDVTVWNSLFWIIILFASVNAVGRSFYHETRSQQHYYYLLARPQAVILAKILYNVILLAALSLLSYLVYSVILGDRITDRWQFLLVLLLSSIGISSLLTLVSAIASRTNNNIGLIAILALPIMIPLLITIIAASKHVADQLDFLTNLRYLGTMAALDVMIIALAYILFPYLWRD
jgi:heme exporter protein B